MRKGQEGGLAGKKRKKEEEGEKERKEDGEKQDGLPKRVTRKQTSFSSETARGSTLIGAAGK